MALDNQRAVQSYIDFQHNSGAIDKNQELEQDTIDDLGLSDGATVEDMLHSRLDPLVSAIFGEIIDNGEVSVSVDLSGVEVEPGIAVDDDQAQKIGETYEHGQLDESSASGTGGVS